MNDGISRVSEECEDREARELGVNASAATAQDRAQLAPRRVTPARRLVEAGGIALVEFHLARRGAEFTRTMTYSPTGDIWARCGSRTIAIEVKSTFDQPGWHIRRSQSASEFYCLVNLEEARCYVLSCPEVHAIASRSPDIFSGVALVRRSAIPKESLENWERLGLCRLPGIMVDRTQPRKYRSARSVTARLKDGTLKTYFYPPTGIDIEE